MISNVNDRHHTLARKEGRSLDVFTLIQSRWKRILFGAVCGMSIAAVYCQFATPVFESIAEILIIGKNGELTRQETGTSEGDVALESSVADEILATHLRVLQSPQIIRTAIDQHNLLSLSSLVRELPDDAKDQRLAAASYIRGQLEVERGGKAQTKDAQVVRALFRHTSEADSATILAAVIDCYQQFISETIQDVGGEAVDLIRQARTDLEHRVEQYDHQYAEFVRNSPLELRSGETVNPHAARLVELEAERSRLEIAESNTRSRLDLVEQVVQQDAITAVDLSMIDSADVQRLTLLMEVDRNPPSGAVVSEYSRLRELRAEAARLTSQLGANHPKVVDTLAQLESLTEGNSQMKALEAIKFDDGISSRHLAIAYARLLRNDLADIQQSKAKVAALIDREQNAARSLVETELQQNRHRRQLERAEALYDAVVERVSELDLLNSYAGFKSAVLTPVEPGMEVWPHIPLLVAVGLLLGAMIGTSSAAWVEMTDKSFRSRMDIEQELQLPVVSSVPVIKKSRKLDSPLDERIAAWHDPDSQVADSVRRVRASVLARCNELASPVVQITSPVAGEGKSTLASNLAVSIALTQRRVLLVDCDLYASHLEKLFGIQADAGLLDRIARDTATEECIYQSSVPNLSVMPSGQNSGYPSEWLSGASFGAFLKSIREQFDCILIDTPGVLSSCDALTVAEQADLIVMMMRLPQAARQRAHEAISQLGPNAENLVGIVVNEVGMPSTYSRSDIAPRVVQGRPRTTGGHGLSDRRQAGYRRASLPPR